MLLALLLTACNAGKPIVPPNDGFTIKVNLLCTTCDDFLRCRRDVAAAAEGVGEPAIATAAVTAAAAGREPLLVYRLREKGFWAQIATIGDYLFQLFRQKTSDERPLAIYRDDGFKRTVEQVPTMAFVDAAGGTVSLPDGRIDLRNGDWLDLRGARLGRCEAMLRREGYALMREFLGRTPAPGATRPAAPVASEPAP